MRPVTPLDERRAATPALHDRALDHLHYIRETMEGASCCTAVPVRGIVLIGATALVAAVVASRTSTVEAWLFTWLADAAAALGIGVATAAWKARSAGLALFSAPGRKAALAFAPPMLAGAALTVVLYRAGRPDLLPGTWLLLYGTGVVTGGAYSVRVVPVMGLGFMLAGAGTLIGPSAWGDPAMAAGFGGLHLLFGLLIWREHGG